MIIIAARLSVQTPIFVPFGVTEHLQQSTINLEHKAFTQWPLSTLAPPHQSHTRSSKRRLETDEDSDEHGRSAKDVSMDRSPTPERPKRAVPKRMRTTPGVITVAKEGKEEQKSGDEAHDVDVGVLLGMLKRICSQDH